MTTETATEESIIERLRLRFSNNVRYKLWNCFVFNGGWETDFFVQQDASGYAYEIEIKISRSDFFADAKKIDKHSIIEHGFYMDRSFKKEHKFRPHRFYYCVPENLISVSEVPKYAGLMYINQSGIFEAKKAPLLHKEKLDFRPVLCDKFYYYNAELRGENRRLRDEVDYLKSRLQEKSFA